MKKLSSAMVLFTTIIAVAACSQGKSSAPSTDDDAAANISGAAIACTKNEDRVVVELGCCDHCNGGRVVAVNSKYVEEVENDYKDDCSDVHACTMRACPGELPRCRDGECEHYTDTSWLE